MITYVKGDATNPLGKGPRIIMHICNDIGKWGKGFVMAVSNKWPNTRRAYLDWFKDGPDFALGNVQFLNVQPYIYIANMVGQHGIKTGSHGPPVRYDAIAECLKKVAIKARELSAIVASPRIGAGLAGGDWNKIETLINEHLADVQVTVYDYE